MDNTNINIEDVLENKAKYSILTGDCLEILKQLPDKCIDCAITSPPYWQQRKYQHDYNYDYIAIGEEKNPSEYVDNLVNIFSEIKRVLKDHGSFWLNLGDKYYNKNLMGMPWRVAIAMQDQGWILRNDIIWDQMKGTQSAKDRFRDVYEHVFHFVKSKKYYYDDDAIRIKPEKKAEEKGGKIISATGVSGKKYYQQIKESELLSEKEKLNALKALDETIEEMREGLVVDFRMAIRGNQRTLHSDNTKISGRAKELLDKGYYIMKMRSNGYLPSNIWRIVPEDKWRKDAHYAVFPEELLLNPIKATCPINGIVIDPFSGTGSTVSTALKMNRRGIGIDLSEHYNHLALKRIKQIDTNSDSK
ncbi:DNA methylase [Natronincola peptidivorans]|uniref:Methyltransferase n=1 Tax=Natronincola peptidivorans TaxID=426128 RepID=A0A1I0GTI8_9FIRM|nr:site-specific DNA-methyltransferase [Natronincola peptidivorans]SET74448.1 DNA methylase [Natronincola peptidivorans]